MNSSDSTEPKPKKWSDHQRGERFKARFYESSEKTKIKRILLFMSGIAITLIGLALVPLPGPGWLVVIFGMGLISGEVLLAARLMDTLDKHILERFLTFYENHKILTIVIVMLIIIVFAGTGYELFIKN